MMKRRTLIRGMGSALLTQPIIGSAQPVGRVYRIGYIGNTATNTPEDDRVWAAFVQALRERGYVEGSNLLLEQRFLEGQTQRAAGIAAELVRLRVDVIMVLNNAGALAAKEATATIPIVMTGISDPVALGLVVSLARPGGNVTGMTAFTDDLFPKRLELLKAAAPKVTRVVAIRCLDCGTPSAAMRSALLNTQAAAAQALGLTLVGVELSSPQAFDAATAAALRERPDALILGRNPVNHLLRRELATFAIAHKLPTVGGLRDEVLAGSLMSYGPSYLDIFRNVGRYIDQIFKGAKPADLPVEQPTKIELVINLKTAKALGLTIPQSLLLRADEVIQ